MTLRPYQEQLVTDCRLAFREHDRVFMQLATGAGKTVIISQMVKSAFEKDYRVWFIVPRNELLMQASAHFNKWKIPHGMINASMQESRAFKIHIVSKDTLISRMKRDKVKNWPQFCIFDEAHVAIDQQNKIISQLPERSKVMGISATPERTDGRGLSDIYNTICYGPTMHELIETGYLSNFKYFCPPIEGIETLHRKGTEYDANELDALLKRRAVYGKAIEHYRELANNQPCIVFCRNIKSAEHTAQLFRDAGYRFESIDGRMAMGKRKAILDGVRDGRLHGVTSVDLAIYGLDIPRLSVAIMLRPTTSKAVYYQQIGRILRPQEGKTAIILDHVNNAMEHSETGNIPLLEDYEWKFYGTEKRKRKKGESALKLKQCGKCWMYYQGDRCTHCGQARDTRKQKKLVEVDGMLVEQKTTPIKDRPFEERKEYHDRIAAAKEAYETDIPQAVKDMCELADEAGHTIMWVYHTLNTLQHAVNISLLTAIRVEKGYKQGWVWFKRQELQKKNRRIA